MANPINPFSAGLIQASIGVNRRGLADTIAALASGNRINRAAQDIAALSAATSLQSEVTGLRAASLNINQASSMLEVADGGMSQIGSILDRMSALSVQANSGALSESGRAGLNAEFQGLVDEINRLAGETNFNDVNLLDGSLSNANSIDIETSQGDQAQGSITFGGNVNAGETIELNGVTLQEGVDFNAGATIEETVQNISNAANQTAGLEDVSFNANGNTLQIEANAAGEAGNQFTIDQGASTATFTVAGDALGGNGVFSLQGGTDAGVSSGDVTAQGSVGDSILASGTGEAAQSTLRFNSEADIQNGDTIQIDDGEGGFTTFTFVNGAPANDSQIEIGANLGETLQNAANTLENFEGAGDFGTRQLDFSVDGNNLVIQSENVGNATDVTGAALDINLGTTGGTIDNTQLNNGSVGGIDVSNVSTNGFVGNLQGFEAVFTGNDSVNVSVNVNGETFSANISDTTVGSDTTVTFTSENGGSFDVTLAGGNGQSVTSQVSADQFANRLDAAFSGVTFSQRQDVANFDGQGDLFGSTLQFESSSSAPARIEDISVNNNGVTSRLEFTVNGERFVSDTLDGDILAGQQVELTANNGDRLIFTAGENGVNLDNASEASSFETGLQNALNFNEGGAAGARFQISSSSDGDVSLQIGDLTAEALLGGNAFNLLTADSAQAAFAAVGQAIDTLTSQRADVGAFQQSLDYAQSNVLSAIQNQDAARSVLTDTDFGATSTLNSLFETQTQAGISTLAQTNRLSGNLLQLLVQ
ncbi:MAG: hypothetical protein MRY32_08760 [Rickettsiales bacterium]|nr:hypothetical protein [Rickettsiales bacterium]